MSPPFKPANIRAWRKAKGLTLIQLGELAGVDHGNLSKLERGIFPYSQSTLEKLADVLGVSVAIILTFKPDEVALVDQEIANSGKGSLPQMQAAWQKICK